MIPLETQRLILRDFVESDWPMVDQYASDREVWPASDRFFWYELIYSWVQPANTSKFFEVTKLRQ